MQNILHLWRTVKLGSKQSSTQGWQQRRAGGSSDASTIWSKSRSDSEDLVYSKYTNEENKVALMNATETERVIAYMVMRNELC